MCLQQWPAYNQYLTDITHYLAQKPLWIMMNEPDSYQDKFLCSYETTAPAQDRRGAAVMVVFGLRTSRFGVKVNFVILNL